MAENPSDFVRDWISENVHAEPSSRRNADARVAPIVERLKSASRDDKIPRDDPELAPDLPRDLIQAAIETPPYPTPGESR